MRLLRAALVAIAILATPGCAAIVSSLPTVIAAVTDAMLVLDAIESFINRYFQRMPDITAEEKARTILARARGALNAALRTAQGAEKLNQAKVDEAFAEFKVAYSELIALLGPFGVRSQGDTLRAAPGSLVVPEPVAMKLRI